MNAHDILDMIGDAKGTYVWDAQQIRDGLMATEHRKMPAKKIWLIAAVIALTVLLVGCAVVYILRMQDLKVGEYSAYIPVAYDEDGNVIPVETRKPQQLLSLQGVYMDALAEWVEFTNGYDLDGTIMGEAERAFREGGPGNPWDFPDNYHLTYGCYSQEMIDKLDDIVAKYDLKLLSAPVTCQRYEMDVMFDALGFEGVILDDPKAEVEYADGDFYLEGSFWLELFLTMDGVHWQCENEIITVCYSVKDYFDPRTSYIRDFDNYIQWDYTRQDGKKVLLALSEGAAIMYADLPEAMMTVSLSGYTWIGGQKVNMTQEALEEIAELLDLGIHPHAAEQSEVDLLKAEALADYEVEQAAKKQNREAQYNAGYQAYVEYYLDLVQNHGGASYIFWDVNGDGVDELVVNGDAILSLKDGESYKYFDLCSTGMIPPRFRPCEGNVFEVWTEDWGDDKYWFYQAGPEDVTFLAGVTRKDATGQWYQNDSSGNQNEITEAEARAIRGTYPNVDFDWIPMKYYGQSYAPPSYTDPYANHIANVLDRYEKAQKVADSVAHICEGGILESSEEHVPDNNGREYYAFYRYGNGEVERIEMVVRDSATSYWGCVEGTQAGRTIREEEALSVINTYKAKRIQLDMKPFAEYPFR